MFRSSFDSEFYKMGSGEDNKEIDPFVASLGLPIISYFKFNGNFDDEFGFNLEPVFNNSLIKAEDVFEEGYKDLSVSFSAEKSFYLKYPAVENIRKPALSFSLFFKLTDTSSSSKGILDIRSDSGTILSVKTYYDKFNINLAGYGYSIPVNSWNHLGISISDGKARFAVNASYFFDFTFDVVDLTKATSLTIGYAYDGGYFEGNIDELMIIDKALTDAEFSTLYKLYQGEDSES